MQETNTGGHDRDSANHKPGPGTLVRSVKSGPLGIHRAEIQRVFDLDGTTFAEVCGRQYALTELEVIRHSLR